MFGFDFLDGQTLTPLYFHSVPTGKSAK